MRKLSLLAAALLTLTAFTTPALAATPVPPQSAAAQVAVGALNFTVLTITGAQNEDRTALLVQILAQWGWPGPGEVLLIRFPDANHDIRFALGPGFSQKGLTVDAMLQLIRSQYLPTAKQGDPEGALQSLMESISRQYDPTVPVPSLLNGLTKAWTLLLNHDSKSLALMASDKLTGEPGVVIAPMAKELANPAINGTELITALDRMLAASKPEIIAYRSVESQLLLMLRGLNRVEITPEGGTTVHVTGLVQIALDRSEDGSYKLLYIATDNGTFADVITGPEWQEAPAAPEADATNPAKVATEFYEWYRAEIEAGRHPIPNGSYLKRVTPALAERVAKAEGADPFLCAQNQPKQVQVESYAAFPTYTELSMKGGPWGDQSWHTWQVKLVQEGELWLIDQVNCRPAQ